MAQHEPFLGGSNVLAFPSTGWTKGYGSLGQGSAEVFTELSSSSDLGYKQGNRAVESGASIEKDAPVDNAVSRDEMLARLEAVDARNDARLKEFIGEVRLSNQVLKSELGAEIKEIGGKIADHRLETKNEFLELKAETLGRSNAVIWNMWLLAIAVLSLVIAIWTFGQDRFSSGLAVTDYIHQVVAERTVRNAPASAPSPK